MVGIVVVKMRGMHCGGLAVSSFEGRYSLPDWSVDLRHLYWFLRDVRAFDSAARRKYYRRIEQERGRLVSSGVNAELLRLVCRWLADPLDRSREALVVRFDARLSRQQRFAIVKKRAVVFDVERVKKVD
jgi:hypothetical protein